MRAGVQATRSALADARPTTLDPLLFERYFPLYYGGFKSRDERNIVGHLRNNADLAFDFRSAADKFRLIDDEDQACVIVPYASDDPEARSVAPLIERLRRGDTDRWLLRALQRYVVSVRRKPLENWQRIGDVQEIQPGLFLLIDTLRYDERRGLLADGGPMAAASLVA